MMQPIINRKDYQLIEIAEDSFVTLMDDEGHIREDLSIDINTDEIHKRIKDDFDSNKNLILTVLKCMQKEKIVASREILN